MLTPYDFWLNTYQVIKHYMGYPALPGMHIQLCPLESTFCPNFRPCQKTLKKPHSTSSCSHSIWFKWWFLSFNMIQKMFSSQNRDFEENFPRSRGFSDFPWIFLCFCRPALVQQAVNDRLDQLDSPRRRGHGRHHTACHLVSPNWCIQNSTLVIYIY